jgi:hypothetical protein
MRDGTRRYHLEKADRALSIRQGRRVLKIKCDQSETFLIVGWEASAAALGGIGRLLLAARRGKGLVYLGSVGTGFTAKTGSEMRRRLMSFLVENPVVTKTVASGITIDRSAAIVSLTPSATIELSPSRYFPQLRVVLADGTATTTTVGDATIHSVIRQPA